MRSDMYKVILGMEVHIELDTESKMFCECPADHFRAEPNSQTCPVCLGLPGALPYPNEKAIRHTITLGHALHCNINKFSKFDRKHYFYPDLPKAYQISQYDLPFCQRGSWKINEEKIGITRIHLEEDTGKLVHRKVDGKSISLVDYNRSGVPLLELVTEPDFRAINQAIEFLKELQLIVRYLGISGADMEKGSMRLEANLSLAKKDSNKLPEYKVELKNINSFKFLEKALKAEIERQSKSLEAGEELFQETRGYDENKDVTFSQRSKEEAQDYRYFPEPDIPPLRFSEEYLDDIRSAMGKLPNEFKGELKNKYNIKENYLDILISEKKRAEFFEQALNIAKKKGIEPNTVANLMVNQNFDQRYKDAEVMVRDIKKEQEKDTVGEDETKQVVKKVIQNNPDPVEEYHSGKTQVIGFLIGQTQKELKGKGNPKLVKELLEKELKN